MSGLTLTDAARKSLAEAVDRYHSQVDLAGPYLSARGIGRVEANTFQLGFVTGDNPADADYAGRLAIPYLTPAAGPIDIRYRAISPDDQPKYLSRPGAESHPFNVKDLLVESDAIYVCEGELDAVISSSVGLPTIGIPGASAFKPHYRLLLQDYERVVVLCDGDEAGRQFGKAIAKEIDTAVPISLPDGMDVNDLYLAGGREAILRMVEI